MDKINHWSLNRTGVVYDSEEVSVLELIGKVTKKTNEVVDKTNEVEKSNNGKVSKEELNKTYKLTIVNNKANFGGSWQGLDRPTLSEEGMRTTVELMSTQLPKKVDKTYFYPSDYGAIGDGITDDTIAFQNMLKDVYKSRYARVIVLDENKTYLLSASLKLNHSISFISKSISANATIKNNTTPIFLIDSEYTTDSKELWTCEFNNVVFEGTESFIKSTNDYVMRDTTFKNCMFRNFKIVFDNVRFIACLFDGLKSGYVNSFGSLSGSDNIFQNCILNHSGSANDFITLNFMYLTNFYNCFLTGHIESGCKAIINMSECKNITFNTCWFDYSDEEAIKMNRSTFNIINKCTFRGNGRVVKNVITIGQCSDINISENVFMPVHVGTQPTDVNIYKIYDSVGYYAKNIFIKNNLYGVNYKYIAPLTDFSKVQNLQIQEPFSSMDYNSEINIIDNITIGTVQEFGITVRQLGNKLLLNGSATYSSNVIIKDFTSSLLNLKTGEQIKFILNSPPPVSGSIKLRITFEDNTNIDMSDFEIYTFTEDKNIKTIGLYFATYTACPNSRILPKLILM